VDDKTWPSIAVVGAGAVGCFFGGMLARAGAPVTLIGRPRHVEAIARHGLLLDSSRFQERIPLEATTNIADAARAQVVLLSVKSVDTEDAARSLVTHLARDAVVVSLQNGVDNAGRIRSVAPGVEVFPAAVYVAAEMASPGCVRHAGRGDLVIGDDDAGGADRAGRHGRLKVIAAMFERAGVPCRISDNIDADLWAKLIMNCAYNAISALTHLKYGRLAHDPGVREVIGLVVDEALAVARAAGIHGIEPGVIDAVWRLANAMPKAMSSTARDLAQAKRTEIDALNGHVARRGAELDVPTPVNATLHALVKVIETDAQRRAITP